MGGAKTILATAPSGKAMSAMVDGLGVYGKMVVIGAASDPIEVAPANMLTDLRSIQGWAAGVAADSEDTLAFSKMVDIHPMIETYPLAKAAEAYDRMMSGKATFRVVLTMPA
jgi:D-arabinose 1-dehydrogenase-like Zn-dependent alcohol dehydrogenase